MLITSSVLHSIVSNGWVSFVQYIAGHSTVQIVTTDFGVGWWPTAVVPAVSAAIVVVAVVANAASAVVVAGVH